MKSIKVMAIKPEFIKEFNDLVEPELPSGGYLMVDDYTAIYKPAIFNLEVMIEDLGLTKIIKSIK